MKAFIPPDIQRKYAERMNSTTIYPSHASLVSHPHEITKLILNATKRNTNPYRVNTSCNHATKLNNFLRLLLYGNTCYCDINIF
jgi:hypothetical protein